MRKGSGNGWLRPKGKSLYFVYKNGAGRERTKLLGPGTLTEEQGWTLVGARGLDKLANQADSELITFGELAEKYLNRYPFNKPSTRALYEQIVRFLMSKWSKEIAIEIDPPALKAWFVDLDVESSTRGKYRSIMGSVYNWSQCEGLIPRGEQFNPCRYVKGREFSAVTPYEAMTLDLEEIFSLLAELEQPEYELTLLVVSCGLRISEALGLRWNNVLWDRELIAIRRSFVHLTLQEGAKNKLSRSRVEVPSVVLQALAGWRRETMYASNDDFIFPSTKLGGKQPRSASMLVEDHIRPAAIRAGIVTVKNGVTYDKDGEVVKRFGFHVLGRHSIATFLMDEGENPAVVQAIMRHSRMDMTLYYSHSRRGAKRAAQEKIVRHLVPKSIGCEHNVTDDVTNQK